MAKQNLSVTKARAKKLKPDTSDLSSYYIQVENPRHVNRMYASEFSGLTPDNLHYYLDASRKGLNFWKSLLFEEIRRRDLRIGAVCQTRKLSVCNKKWDISYSSESSIPETTQKKYSDFIRNNFDRINLAQFITDIVEAQIQGVSTFEITYQPEAGKLLLGEICYNPNYLLLFNDLTNEYCYLDHTKADAMQLRTLGWNTSQDRIDVTMLQIEKVNPLKILEVESLDGNAQNGFQNGCIDSLIWAFLFKNYGLKDWSIYIERFASPGVVGKYPGLLNKSDKAKLFEAVRKWGNLFKATIPDTCSLELITDTTKGTTNTLFESYVDYWDKNITIRVLGQSLTTDIGKVGSKAAAETHDAVREDLVDADMILVAHTINQLIQRLININFGAQQEYPKFRWAEVQSIDYKVKRADIMSKLKLAGYNVTKDDAEKEFGFELEGIETIEPTPEEEQNYISNYIKKYFDGLQR